MEAGSEWRFNIAEETDAQWAEGLRRIFDYRDLGVKAATNGDFIAHVIRANGKREEDAVAQWHVHECDFQMVYVLNGWAQFEYEGEGVRTIRKGDCINQRPMIKHREGRLFRRLRGPRDRRPGRLQDRCRRRTLGTTRSPPDPPLR